MTGKCCICGYEEELRPELVRGALEAPLICDRPECEARAQEIGWDLLFNQFIETKPADDGEMLFRRKRGDVE